MKWRNVEYWLLIKFINKVRWKIHKCKCFLPNMFVNCESTMRILGISLFQAKCVLQKKEIPIPLYEISLSWNVLFRSIFATNEKWKFSPLGYFSGLRNFRKKSNFRFCCSASNCRKYVETCSPVFIFEKKWKMKIWIITGNFWFYFWP